MAFFTDLLLLTATLGVPVALLSWYLFGRLYDRGDLDKEQKPAQALKAHKKRSKLEGIKESHPIQKRWMKFGGGYYGLTALWTLVVIELIDASQFIMNFPGFAALFADGIVSFVIDFFINQFSNFVTAFLWFGYWENLFACIAASYGGYLLGINVAQRGFRIGEQKRATEVALSFFKSQKRD